MVEQCNPPFLSVANTFTVETGSWFSKKNKFVKVCPDQIQVLNTLTQKKNINAKLYQDLLGITTSLRSGNKDFIFHFRDTPDEQWLSQQREQLIKAVSNQYKVKEGKPLKVFGISAKTLEDYLTTEKDIKRGVHKMPGQAFVLGEDNLEQCNDDEDEMWGDEWVLIDNGTRQKEKEFNPVEVSEQIKRETISMQSSVSTCLLVNTKNSQAGEVRLEDFVIKKVIDKGSFGKVFLVQNSNTGKVYAMKRLNKDVILQKNQVENIKVEKQILFQADHPFVNSMEYVFQNELRIYFFLKYVPGGNIYDNLYKVQRFSEQQVKFISAQIVLALGYLHANQIVHRDLKPENVLMDEKGYICLADFGLAKYLKEQDQTFSFCGTAEYLAPEVLDMKGHGFAVDWWTLGILMYEMSTGRPPFMNKSHHKLGLLIRTGKIIFPDPVRHGIEMSAHLQDLIIRLLDRDPSTRIGSGTEDAKQIIAHPFFEGINWSELQDCKLQAPYIPEARTDTMSDQSLDLEQQVQSDIQSQDAFEQMQETQVQYIKDNQDQFKGF